MRRFGSQAGKTTQRSKIYVKNLYGTSAVRTPLCIRNHSRLYLYISPVYPKHCPAATCRSIPIT